MQITALIKVINYLKETSGDPVLIEGYKKLTEVVKEASGNPQGDFEAELSKEKKQLQHFFIKSDPSDWGYASYSLFGKINKDQLFGKAASDYLENLITPENKDYKAIYSDLNKKVKQISKLSETLSRFQQLFDQIVPLDVFQLADKNDSKSSLFLYFEGHMSVQNITDLERCTRLWGGILSTFSRLTDEETLTLDINSCCNGNVALGIVIEDKTLNTIRTGVIEILTTLPFILKIRKIQIELASLLLYDNLSELLEEEIQTLINQRAIESAQKLTSNYLNDTLDTEEMTNDISRSLKQILSFVEKGGKIEFKPLLSTQETVKTNKTLTELFTIAHELERVTDSLSISQVLTPQS